MKTFSTPRLSGFNTRRRERGITLIFVVVAIFALLGVAALAIDLVTLYVSKAEAQRVADAAALAGAKGLIDSGVTADPSNSQNDWAGACAQATAQAQGVATRGKIGGSPPPLGNVTITFGSGGALGVCPSSGTPGTGFGVNPEIAVTVRSNALPLFLAKIWGQRTSTVSATSLAEGFNPSGTNVPVASKCIAPWIMANIDPILSTPGTPPTFVPMIDTSGQIHNTGLGLPTIIGQDIALQVGCSGPSNCSALLAPKFASPPSPPPPSRVTYYPADLGTPATSGPSCSLSTAYENNIVACNPKPIACGDTIAIDTTIYPDGVAANAPNKNAIQCLINAAAPNLGQGQDTLNVAGGFPYPMHAGSNNPLAVSGVISTNDVISSSRSVVTIPIYNSVAGVIPTSPVTVIGFAQAFVKSVRPSGRPEINILNISGCQLPRTNTPVGTNSASSVPVRLIHP